MLGIPHTAFLSVIFGMMLLSFPMGMFVIFESDIGQEINFALPLGALEELEGLDLGPLAAVEMGDAFIVIWSAYAILFAVAILGPRAGFMNTTSTMLSQNEADSKSNYMVAVTQWFSITILVSVAIGLVQDAFGVPIVPPAIENDLIEFFFISLAPLVEEAGFRVLLIGVPLFAFYGYRASRRHFIKSLWSPSSTLHIHDPKKPLVLIFIVGVMFGFAHIATDGSWSEGKFAQASAGGIILGWAYFRYGFVVALLIHWATNYFIFAYAGFLAHVNETTLDGTFTHPLFSTMEILFLISGALSLVMIVGRYNDSRQSASCT